MDIIINVNNKIASNIKDTPIVCGNTNYVLRFNLDEEWTGHTDSTYVYYTIDGEKEDAIQLLQDTSGYYVVMPYILRGRTLLVGLRCIKDPLLYTTSSARIDLIKSIEDYIDDMELYSYKVEMINGQLTLVRYSGEGAMQIIETIEMPAWFGISAPQDGTGIEAGCLLYSYEEPTNEE